MTSQNNAGNVTCPDCAILSRKLEAAQNRIADDCESAESALARAVAERRQFERALGWCRIVVAAATVAGFVAGRLLP